MSREGTVRPWVAALLAVAPALVAVVLVEAARLAMSVSGAGFVGALSEVSTSGVRQLSVSVLLTVVSSLALRGAMSKIRWKRLAWCGALIGIVGLQIALVRLVAIGAPHLSRNHAVTTVFVALAVIYGAALLWISWVDRAPRARRYFGGVVLVASLVAAAAHYQVFVGLYLTLHTCVSMLAFLGVHTGITMLLIGATMTAWRVGGLIGAPVVLLAFGTFVPTPATARSRGRVAAQSALARPVMIAETPAELLRPSTPPERRIDGPMRPDDSSIERFESHTKLPRLPDQFDLVDHDVLMVIIDATRYDRTSLADVELGTTPTHRALVKRGAFSYTRAYSPSNGTFPSMSSLLSMTIPSFAQVEIHDRHWHGNLRQEQLTAADVFSKAGRRTFWVGFNFKKVMTIRVHGIASRFDHHHLELIWPGRDLDADARIVNRAIREIRAARGAGKRYFGLLCLSSPHDDYQVHDRRRPADTPIERYDQEIRYADRQLRRLLDEVARGGGMDRTVVIVTSDHGEAFGEHRHRFHLSSLYSEQVRVPLVIWTPGLQGAVIDEPTSNLFVLPWLLLKGDVAMRGVASKVLRSDLGPLLRETKGAVVSEFISRQRQEATLRYSDYTIYYDLLADDFRVFDARSDPGEENDLSDLRPDLVERFLPSVKAYRNLRFAGQRYFFRPIVGERAR